jgi:hypothetical protein
MKYLGSTNNISRLKKDREKPFSIPNSWYLENTLFKD